jgi:hypothetical protein
MPDLDHGSTSGMPAEIGNIHSISVHHRSLVDLQTFRHKLAIQFKNNCKGYPRIFRMRLAAMVSLSRLSNCVLLGGYDMRYLFSERNPHIIF